MLRAMTPLAGKRALVTGASAGIGAATARALARAGAHVVLAARRRPKLEALAAEIGRADVLTLDVRDAGAVAAALEGLELDVVVNNAGLAHGVHPLQAGKLEDWASMIETNVKGVLNVLHATLPGLAARGAGDHVFLGSVAGRQVYPGGNVYCATKSAVRALYEAARIDLCGTGVRVTTVDAGAVQSEFSLVRFEGDRERAAAVYRGFEPLRPEDVADAILWAVTRPAHVNVGEIVLWPAQQASTTLYDRRSTAGG